MNLSPAQKAQARNLFGPQLLAVFLLVYGVPLPDSLALPMQVTVVAAVALSGAGLFLGKSFGRQLGLLILATAFLAAAWQTALLSWPVLGSSFGLLYAGLAAYFLYAIWRATQPPQTSTAPAPTAGPGPFAKYWLLFCATLSFLSACLMLFPRPTPQSFVFFLTGTLLFGLLLYGVIAHRKPYITVSLPLLTFPLILLFTWTLQMADATSKEWGAELGILALWAMILPPALAVLTGLIPGITLISRRSSDYR